MRDKKNILFFSAISALPLWALYVAIGAFVFHQSYFSDRVLFGRSSSGQYLWLLIIIGFILYGVMIFKMVYRRSLALEALRESEVTLQIITRAAKDAIVMMDDQGNISFWNPAAEQIFGFAAHEVIGRGLPAVLAPQQNLDAYQDGLKKIKASMAGAPIGRTIELTAVKKDGSEFPIELSLSALQQKETWFAVGILRDIAERKRTEEALRKHRAELESQVAERTEELTSVNELLRKEILDRTRTEDELFRSETFLNTIFDSFRDPFSIVDRDYKLVKFNEVYTRTRNKRASDLYGKKCYEIFHNRTGVCDECVIARTFRSGDPCAKEKLLTSGDGSQVWVEIYTYPIFDQNKAVSHVVEYSRDITGRKKTDEEKKQLINKLNHLSTTDSLTGLLNRRALNDMLSHEIERATRYNTELSLILCDVDRFKKINDTFGHRAGDHALQAVAEALIRSVRRVDIVGRYGGDEFMIIMPETSVPGAHSLAEKVRVAVNELDLGLPGGERVSLSLSLGVVGCCASPENIDTLVALADAHLYAAKQAGRNRVYSVPKNRDHATIIE